MKCRFLKTIFILIIAHLNTSVGIQSSKPVKGKFAAQNVTPSSFKEYGRKFDIYRFFRDISYGRKQALSTQRKNIIPLLGLSGVGKSTLCNHLTGVLLEGEYYDKDYFYSSVDFETEDDRKNRRKYFIKVKNKSVKHAIIGSGTVNQTMYAASYYDAQSRLYYCDTPSLDSNMWREVKYAQKIITRVAIDHAKSIQAVAFVIAKHNLDSYTDMKCLAEIWYKMVSKNPGEYADSILFFFTKGNEYTLAKYRNAIKCLYIDHKYSLKKYHEPYRVKLFLMLKQIIDKKENCFCVDPLASSDKTRNKIVNIVKKAVPIPKEAFYFIGGPKLQKSVKNILTQNIWQKEFNNDHKDKYNALLYSCIDADNQEKEKKTGLHIATNYGDTDIVTLLLKNGANPNIQDQNGDTALHVAANHGNTDIMKLLLAYKADAALKNKCGKAPLYYATVACAIKLLKAALK